MPIYEYVCRQCGEPVEKLQKLSDDPLTDCPACGEAALKRKVSAVGFRLAGAGWYETDFKSDGQRYLAGDKDSADKSEKSSSGDGNSKSGDKADNKNAKTAGERSASDKKSEKPAAKSGETAKKSATGKSAE